MQNAAQQQDVAVGGKAKKRRGPMARFLRWTCILLLSPIIVFLVLTALLYVPFIQDWAVGIACDKLSEKTGMDVKVERVRLKFPLDIDLQNLCITQPASAARKDGHSDGLARSGRRFTQCPYSVAPSDTVLAVRSCVVDLDLCGIFSLNVGVDAFDLNDVRVDTHDMIATMVMRGHLDDFHLGAHDLEIKQDRVNITTAMLDGCDLDIALKDTTVVDTTESESKWKIDFRDVSLKNTRIAFHTANDTMSVMAGVRRLELSDGHFDTMRSKLQLGELGFDIDSVHYDQNYLPRSGGIDFNHLSLFNLSAALPSLDFDAEAGRLQTSLSSFKVREKSGFELRQLKADIDLDTTHIKIDNAILHTPTSHLTAKADIDWAALATEPTPFAKPGSMDVALSAEFSKQDVLSFAGDYLPAHAATLYPNTMLTAGVKIGGNLQHIDIKTFSVSMPGMFDAEVSGSAGNLLSDDGLAANLDWDIHAEDLSLVKKMFGITDIKLPAMDIVGSTNLQGSNFRANLNVCEGKGTLNIDGQYNLKTDAYNARLDMQRFAVSNFVPMDSAMVVTGKADLDGNTFDILSNHARFKALLDVPSARYGRTEWGKIRLEAALRNGKGDINFYSGGQRVKADGCLEVALKNKKIDSAQFVFDMRELDFYALGITKKPLKASMSMHMTGNTNLKDCHYAKGEISAIHLVTKDSMYYPRDIALETLLNPDTTYAFVSAGDLLLNLNSTDGVSALMQKAAVLADSIGAQMELRQYKQDVLKSLMPKVDLCVKSGQRNPLVGILGMMTGKTYHDVDIDLHTDSVTGIQGEGYVHGFNLGSFVLDTISFNLVQDTAGIDFNASIINGKKNRDATFKTLLKSNITPSMIDVGLKFYDARNVLGVDLGAEAVFHHGDVRVHLTPLHPILAERRFTVNADNFLELKSNGRIEANLNLLADDGTGLKLYSSLNEDADQDITASLNHFNLGEICARLPYLPRITGLLHGDIHYMQMGSVTSVGADLEVQNMFYEGCEMGNIGINAAYMPNEDGSHYVDGFMTQNQRQVLSFTGLYEEVGKTDRLDAEAIFSQFPLELANGFLDESMQLKGSLKGGVHVTGSTSKPRIDGKILTDSMHIVSPLYSINMRFENDSLKVENSHLNINKLRAYTTGKTPLTFDGNIDFSNLSNMNLDVTAKANNFELINAPRNRKAAAYGKVYVDLDVRAKGRTSNLNVTGRLGVLGNTNVTYVLLDSPITVEDEMSDLVTFCDFSDTIEVEEPVYDPPSNLTMRLNIGIDQAANAHVLLSEDGKNFINLEGGGDLIMSYNGTKGLQMNGRYNILEGTMTYSMMVLTLKDCAIKNGSYVEFVGDIDNPHLNIIAEERVKSNITENGTPRSVAFDVGLFISQTLDNMGLEFMLDAPEDMSVQNEIAAMSSEEKSRTAVTLLATGMYITENGSGSSGGFNTTNALNAFLQSQIAGITGKALNTIDLSFGVANNTTSSGSTTTDYSFRFAKRFWGNRISLIIGGKVSSGSEAVNSGQSIIDNVSIEYRLDKSATRYVNLFYDNNRESILEGQVMEMGAGLVLRRKTNKLGELFLFRNPKPNAVEGEEIIANEEKKRKKKTGSTSRAASHRASSRAASRKVSNAADSQKDAQNSL